MNEAGARRHTMDYTEYDVQRGIAPQSEMELRGQRYGLNREEFRQAPPPTKLFVGIELSHALKSGFPLLKFLKKIEAGLPIEPDSSFAVPPANERDREIVITVRGSGSGFENGVTEHEPLHLCLQSETHEALLQAGHRCDIKLGEIRAIYKKHMERRKILLGAWTRAQDELKRSYIEDEDNIPDDTADFEALIDETIRSSPSASTAGENQGVNKVTREDPADLYDPLNDIGKWVHPSKSR